MAFLHACRSNEKGHPEAEGAVEAGALAANYLEVTGFVKEQGRIQGIEVADRITGAAGTIRAQRPQDEPDEVEFPWTV